MVRTLSGSLLALACWVQPPTAQFGTLPDGFVGRVDLDGVRAEVAMTLLVDSATAESFVPAGFQVVTLEQIAANDPATANLLAARPNLRTAVPSILGFTRLDSLRVDLEPPVPAAFAFWWLAVLPNPAIDERALGNPTVDVAFWTPETDVVRSLEPYWPHARVAGVSIDESEDGEWRVNLELPEGTVTGRCRPVGPVSHEEDAAAGYSTLWSAGPRPTTFTVITSYGQTTRSCEATWDASGSHALAAAVRATLEEPPPWMGTSLVRGWQARAGVYRR